MSEKCTVIFVTWALYCSIMKGKDRVENRVNFKLRVGGPKTL